MANTITGRILFIGNVETIPSKNGGEPFKKRLVVLNCTRMDFGKTYENYPSFEFSGKHLEDPADFKIDDIVTVSFVIQGTKYHKDNQPEKFFNTVTGYKIERYYRDNHSRNSSEQVAASTKPSTPQFPPSVDDNGCPVDGDNDLPF